jgi:hypothetical protein
MRKVMTANQEERSTLSTAYAADRLLSAISAIDRSWPIPARQNHRSRYAYPSAMQSKPDIQIRHFAPDHQAIRQSKGQKEHIAQLRKFTGTCSQSACALQPA